MHVIYRPDIQNRYTDLSVCISVDGALKNTEKKFCDD